MGKKLRCPKCGSLKTQKYGRREIGKRDRRRNVQLFRCSACLRCFTLRRKRDKQLSLTTKRKLTKASLEGRTSFRTLRREKGFEAKWNGILSFDGKLARVYSPYAKINGRSFKQKAMFSKQTWLVGVDTKTKGLPHSGLVESENLADLVKYFKALKEIGYPLRVLIRDGNLDIERAARIVFENSFSTQLCLRHFTQSLKRKLKSEKKNHKEETEFLVQSIKEALRKKRRRSV